MVKTKFSPYGTRFQRLASRVVRTFVTRDVRITDDDIVNGIPFRPSECPMALATKRAFPNAAHVAVGPSTINVLTREVHEGFVREISERWEGGLALTRFTRNVDWTDESMRGVDVPPVFLESDPEWRPETPHATTIRIRLSARFVEDVAIVKEVRHA